MRLRLRLSSLALVLVIGTAALAGCGDDDDGGEGAEATSQESDGGASEPSGGGVPDACNAFDPADLSAAFGDVGEGTSNSVVASRTVCMYESGTIVGVSEGDQYDGTVDVANEANECEEISGAGERATFCITGPVGQLLWLDGDLMFDLTAMGEDPGPYLEVAGKSKL